MDVDDFNNGKMVIITNKAGAGPKEDWVVVEKENGEFQAPDGYKIMDIDESNIGEYLDRVSILCIYLLYYLISLNFKFIIYAFISDSASSKSILSTKNQ